MMMMRIMMMMMMMMMMMLPLRRRVIRRSLGTFHSRRTLRFWRGATRCALPIHATPCHGAADSGHPQTCNTEINDQCTVFGEAPNLAVDYVHGILTGILSHHRPYKTYNVQVQWKEARKNRSLGIRWSTPHSIRQAILRGWAPRRKRQYSERHYIF